MGGLLAVGVVIAVAVAFALGRTTASPGARSSSAAPASTPPRVRSAGLPDGVAVTVAAPKGVATGVLRSADSAWPLPSGQPAALRPTRGGRSPGRTGQMRHGGRPCTARLAVRMLVGLGLLTPLLLPGTAAAQAEVYRSKITGPAVHAYWTTFPRDGRVEAGVVYTGTGVFVSDVLYQSGSARHRHRALYVDELRFTYDEQGDFMPLLAINARLADPAAFTFSIDRALTSAFAQATVRQTICTPPSNEGLTRRSLYLCGGASEEWRDGGTAQVSVSWTGAGDLVDAGKNSVLVLPPCFTIQHHQGDVFRPATATGTFSGRDLGTPDLAPDGIRQFADLFLFRSGHLSVAHSPQAPREMCAPPPPPPE